jgi:hypothetical protein
MKCTAYKNEKKDGVATIVIEVAGSFEITWN